MNGAPALVIRHVSDFLWARDDYRNAPFVVAGSYRGAVQAQSRGFSMVYNDIDVYIEAPLTKILYEVDLLGGNDGLPFVEVSCEDDNLQKKTNLPFSFIDVWYEEHSIPGFDVKVNFVSLSTLDLNTLIDSFDINAIRVGFSVKCVQGAGPMVDTWDDQRPEFQLFLQTRTLRLYDIKKLPYPASAFVRLLCKAQQLGLNYELPDEELLVNTLHRRCFAGSNNRRFESLTDGFLEEVTRRFEIKHIYWSEHDLWLKMFQALSNGDDDDELFEAPILYAHPFMAFTCKAEAVRGIFRTT